MTPSVNMPAPQAPAPPPNPPMFGSALTSAAGARQRAGASMNAGFAGTILGGSPATTGQKTLLGQ